MQHVYNYNDQRKVQVESYPLMCWSQNYRYAGNAIPWTLFFGGNLVAPSFKVDGVGAQEYLQVPSALAACVAMADEPAWGLRHG